MASSFDNLFAEPRPPEEGTLYLGRRVGPYAIDRLIADHQYCSVFLAQDVELRRPSAVKLLKRGPWLTDSVRARFRREGRVLAQLRHPHIITLYGVHSLENQPCLAFEFVRGRTLAEVLPLAPVDPVAVVRIVSQIARGLATAHRRGVIHRDLKPQNVLLDDDVDDPELRTDWGAVKVTDFGIAKILDDFESMTLTGNIQPGTPSFMAPEQVEGRKDLIGPATDVHALGLLMYLLLTGKNPFQADYVSKTLQRIVNDLPPPPSDLVSGIPSWLNDACLRCLEKSPGRRFPSAAELVQEFSDRAVRRSTPRASDDRTLPTTPPAAAMSHRSMWRNLGLVAAVLFLIAAVSLRLLGFPR